MRGMGMARYSEEQVRTLLQAERKAQFEFNRRYGGDRVSPVKAKLDAAEVEVEVMRLMIAQGDSGGDEA